MTFAGADAGGFCSALPCWAAATNPVSMAQTTTADSRQNLACMSSAFLFTVPERYRIVAARRLGSGGRYA